MAPHDDLDELVAARHNERPGFAALVQAAERRREFGRALGAVRKRQGLSQTRVAERMGARASMIHRVEGGLDVRVSTIQKYAAALGYELRMRLRRA
jgi:ribosome-binding protein aMBF1 (putative translation factor)